MCPAVPHTHSHPPRVHDAQLSWDAALPSSEDAMSTTGDADQLTASKISQVSNLSLHTRKRGLHSGLPETWPRFLPWPKQPVLPGPSVGPGQSSCATKHSLFWRRLTAPRAPVSSGPGLDTAPGWASPGTPHAWGPPSRAACPGPGGLRARLRAQPRARGPAGGSRAAPRKGLVPGRAGPPPPGPPAGRGSRSRFRARPAGLPRARTGPGLAPTGGCRPPSPPRRAEPGRPPAPAGVAGPHLLHDAGLPLAEGGVAPQLVVDELHLDLHPAPRLLPGLGAAHGPAAPAAAVGGRRCRARRGPRRRRRRLGQATLHAAPLAAQLLLLGRLRVSLAAAVQRLPFQAAPGRPRRRPAAVRPTRHRRPAQPRAAGQRGGGAVPGPGLARQHRGGERGSGRAGSGRPRHVPAALRAHGPAPPPPPPRRAAPI